jgi:hypothetical protein
MLLQPLRGLGLRVAGWIGDWIKSRLPRRKKPGYRLVNVEDFPDILKPLEIYIAGEKANYWGAALLCPCGCGQAIQLNLLKDARPCWHVHEEPDGSISIEPSIWRQKGCKSHFFVRNSKIEWSRMRRD